jgi:hypothetical protein
MICLTGSSSSKTISAENAVIFSPVFELQSIGPFLKYRQSCPWRPGQVVSPLPATEETGAMGREIESRQGGCFFTKNTRIFVLLARDANVVVTSLYEK